MKHVTSDNLHSVILKTLRKYENDCDLVKFSYSAKNDTIFKLFIKENSLTEFKDFLETFNNSILKLLNSSINERERYTLENLNYILIACKKIVAISDWTLLFQSLLCTSIYLDKIKKQSQFTNIKNYFQIFAYRIFLSYLEVSLTNFKLEKELFINSLFDGDLIIECDKNKKNLQFIIQDNEDNEDLLEKQILYIRSLQK